MKKFYDLVCEDITSVGGPMGSERTVEIFRRAFAKVETAKAFAEKDHRRRDKRLDIHWERSGRTWHSGDLLSHDYTIRERTLVS